MRESKNIEAKVKAVQDKFTNLVKITQQRATLFNEVSNELEDFTLRVENFDEW